MYTYIYIYIYIYTHTHTYMYFAGSAVARGARGRATPGSPRLLPGLSIPNMLDDRVSVF